MFKNLEKVNFEFIWKNILNFSILSIRKSKLLATEEFKICIKEYLPLEHTLCMQTFIRCLKNFLLAKFQDFFNSISFENFYEERYT